jgi:PAS domain S-box-containing protein
VSDARLLREILDSQLEMVCRFRRDGTILFVNRAYAEGMGQPAEDLVGQNLWQFIPEEDRAGVAAQLDQLTPDNAVVVIENRIDTPDGIRWSRWRTHGLTWDDDGNLLEAQSTGFDVTERKQFEEQRQLMIDELNHRVRNTLTVVQGIAYQTFRGTDIPGAPVAAFNSRLHALAGAHAALSQADWTGADISEVVRQGLATCGDDIARIERSGPAVRQRPNAVLVLVLVLHELATNAAKHGALSNHTGRVALAWRLLGGDRLEVTWQETGGPPVSPPERTGFGSRLITRAVTRQLEGEVDLDYAAAGLTCRLAFPLRSARSSGELS